MEQDKKLEKELTSIVNGARIECYLNPEAPDIFDKSIIRKIVSTLSDGGQDCGRYLSWIEARKTKHYYHEFEDIYAALVSAIELIRLSESYEEEKILANTPHELFRTYTDRYYLLDYYYRKFYSSYDETSDKDILKISIREIVERQYLHITQKIQMKWSDLITAQGRTSWGVELIDTQEHFYSAHVDKIVSRNDRDKVAVIISDAMRYEVAVELKEILNKNTNGTIELTYIAGCLPSYTWLGMAALLPHTKLELEKEEFLVDGMNSEGIENRGKILIKTREESIALRFKDLRDLKRDEAREKIRGKRVIYIYHNKIDDTGDNQSSEDEVFKAADETIQEIEDMVNRLVNSLNISNIIITADHGFLYTRDALKDIDAIEIAGFDKDRFITSNKRFIISSEKTDLMNTHCFLMDYISDAQKPLYLYTPYADLRFKMAGIRFKDKDGIQILKDYMASGSFARGKDQINANASIVFVGNVNESIQSLLKTAHLFAPFPDAMNNDSAFFDRIHYYLPGWEVPKFRPEHFTGRYGFIVDYLAEYLREMRKRSFSDTIFKYFRFGSNLNQRDVIAIKKTCSGLLKLIYPDDSATKEDVREILEYALVGRRRVKEQLKKMGGIEFYDVNFSYFDNEEGTEHFVTVPESGGCKLIPEGMTKPGHIYSVSRNEEGKMGVYKFELQVIAGSGKYEKSGLGSNMKAKGSIQTVFNYFKANAKSVSQSISTKERDYQLHVQDLMGVGISDELALPAFISLCSGALGKPVHESIVILGTFTIGGSVSTIDNLSDLLQIALDAGAKKVLIPISSAGKISVVPPDLFSKFQISFYEDPVDAVYKSLVLA